MNNPSIQVVLDISDAGCNYRNHGMNHQKPNLEFIERYQLLYNKDPLSKVFAPLAEGYRKLGYLKQALEIAERGVRMHPHFPSGRVALARVLLDLDRAADSIPHLESAVELSPENILAHGLLADAAMKLGQPKLALKAYKMLLFLNPNDERAQKHVRKLESLTADEYEDDVFELKPLEEVARILPASDQLTRAEEKQLLQTHPPGALDVRQKQRHLERLLSLTDAFIVRSDVERATQTLVDAERVLGSHPEIQKRKKILAARNPLSEERMSSDEIERSVQKISHVHKKIQKLEHLLEQINQRRADRS